MKATLDFRDDLIDKEVAEKLSKEVTSYIIEQVKNNMKTIKERAKEYSKGQWDEPTANKAYIDGAKEQKAIDIDKACEWLKENARDYACATVRCPYREEEEIICDVHLEIVEDFRKAMEE